MQTPPYPESPSRRSMPFWAWILIGCGCLCLGALLILPAILFPVFRQARESARAASCLSNEKQMALATFMYAQDYDEILPAASHWQDYDLPYLKSTSMFHCPAVSMQDPSVFGYAYNKNLSKRALADIISPKDTIMLYDSSTLTANATDSVSSLPAPGRHLRKGNNVGFADGHCRMIKDGDISLYDTGEKSPSNKK